MAAVLNPVINPVLNLSLSTGVVPAVWKQAFVIPLLKKPNLDPEGFANYRPISLLPALAKVVEKHVQTSLSNFLETNNLLHSSQSSFRANEYRDGVAGSYRNHQGSVGLWRIPVQGKGQECTDESADEPSETPVDQKDDETNVKQELNSDHTLKGEQPASNGLQSEEKSKNELQVGETVNHVKEESEASNNQTKEGQISPNSEDLKLAQAKGATSEIKKVNCEGKHSEPEVGSTVSAESKPEETKSAIVEKKESDICPNNTSENKAKEAPTTIQSTDGANENPTECTADSDKNVNGADEPVSSISTENTCSAQSVKEKDSICLNTVKPSVNSACSNPPTDVVCQDTPPSALQESPNTKNNSEGRRIDGGLLKSSDEVLQVSYGDTLSKQSLVDRSTIESVKTAISNSDNLIKSTESHKDESNNCELLNTAQETKSECLNTENRSGVKQDSCTAQGEDIGVIAREGECSAQKHQDAPEDQISTLSETKPDQDSVPKLEDSVSLEGSIAPPKVETQAEIKIVDEATEVTVIDAESITAGLVGCPPDENFMDRKGANDLEPSTCALTAMSLAPKWGIFKITFRSVQQSEKKVLSKGLGFVPTNQPNVFNVKSELYAFFQKIHPKYFFRNSDTNLKKSLTGLRILSTCFPPTYAMSNTTLVYENMVQRDVSKILDSYKHSVQNITKLERAALVSLKNNNDIVIKAADKGGTIVIQDATAYKTEIQQQLQDGISYARLRTDPSKDLAAEIFTFTSEALELGFLSKLEFEYLNQLHPRLPMI
ncbi:uncharacterized protein LOC144798025 [Lissotriton helveticus]